MENKNNEQKLDSLQTAEAIMFAEMEAKINNAVGCLLNELAELSRHFNGGYYCTPDTYMLALCDIYKRLWELLERVAHYEREDDDPLEARDGVYKQWCKIQQQVADETLNIATDGETPVDPF